MYPFYNLHLHKKEIIKKLEAGIPQKRIAEDYNVTYNSWRAFYNKYIIGKNPTPKRIKSYDENIEKEIIKRADAGFSIYRISKNLNLSYYQVLRCLEEHKLKNKTN